MMKRLFASAALAALTAAPAFAHFQLVYSPDPNIERPGDVPLKLIFWHPMENGHAMDMGAPEDLFALFKGDRIDLTGSLSPITFAGADNTAAAYQATLPVKRNGDYIVALTPAPYYEGSEDIYIQQITKVFFNKGGVPTGWNEPAGLPTEFVPLNKPNNVIAGSTFSAQLLSEGEPVPGAEIEIEYIAAEPDMDTNAAGAASVGAMPGGALVAITDENGVFTFGIPRAGHWGFAALGSGPETEHQGKELSQDAVIWIKAYDLE
ncbi:cobalt/nickel transport protein [Rhodovulum adriaticum]|uniref:Cobalt/nickel transport protein n=2 Tax=Rhodovulum adriaticum TaxID=35804 RepID=A0A4R2NKF2_RHOAD|nr:cobalt/nickel transport protein [Rhodovulum adriaticum]